MGGAGAAALSVCLHASIIFFCTKSLYSLLRFNWKGLYFQKIGPNGRQLMTKVNFSIFVANSLIFVISLWKTELNVDTCT